MTGGSVSKVVIHLPFHPIQYVQRLCHSPPHRGKSTKAYLLSITHPPRKLNLYHIHICTPPPLLKGFSDRVTYLHSTTPSSSTLIHFSKMEQKHLPSLASLGVRGEGLGSYFHFCTFIFVALWFLRGGGGGEGS